MGVGSDSRGLVSGCRSSGLKGITKYNVCCGSYKDVPS